MIFVFSAEKLLRRAEFQAPKSHFRHFEVKNVRRGCKFLVGIISLALAAAFLASGVYAGEAARVFIFKPLVASIRGEKDQKASVVRPVDEDSPMVAVGKEEGWHRVRLADGKEGWIWWPLVRPLPQREGFIITGSFVWTSREEKDGAIMAEVLGNVSFPIVESAPGPWYRVELPDGNSGWVWGEVGKTQARGVGERYQVFSGRTPLLIAAESRLEKRTVNSKAFYQIKRAAQKKPVPVEEAKVVKPSLAEIVGKIEYPQEIDFGDLQVGSEATKAIEVKSIPKDVGLEVAFEDGERLSLQGGIAEPSATERVATVKATGIEKEGERKGAIILKFKSEGKEETRRIAYRMNVIPKEIPYSVGIFPQRIDFGTLRMGQKGEPQDVNVVVKPTDARLTIEPDPSDAIAISSNIEDRGGGEYIVKLTPLARKSGEHAGEIFLRFELPSGGEKLEKVAYQFTARSVFALSNWVYIIGGGLIVIAFLVLVLILRIRGSSSRRSASARVARP